MSGASRGALPSWPARWLPAPGRRPRGGDTSTGPLPGPASLTAPAPRTPGRPAACGSSPRPSSWLEGPPCAPHTSPPRPGDPALNQQTECPWAPYFLGDGGSHGTQGAGRQGAPPHLQSPLQLCLYSAGLEKRWVGKGLRSWHPQTRRQGLARQSEGPLCQSTSRAHTLPGAPWEPSQEDNWGQNPPLPTTPQDNLGAPGSWREQGGAEESKPVLHRSPPGSF